MQYRLIKCQSFFLHFLIRQSFGVEPWLRGPVEYQGKVSEMTDSMEEYEAHYPTQRDIDAILEDARQMRSRVLCDGVSSFWAMLRRGIVLHPVQARTSEV